MSQSAVPERLEPEFAEDRVAAPKHDDAAQTPVSSEERLKLDPTPGPGIETDQHLRAIRRSLAWLLVLATLAAMYQAQAVLLPVVIAILLTLVLRTPVRWLSRLGVPVPISAVFVIILIAGFLGLSGYLVSGPAVDLAGRAPDIAHDLRLKFSGLIARFADLREMAENQGLEIGGGTGIDWGAIAAGAVGSLASVGSSVLAALILSMFLLASGDLFHRRIVEVSPRLTDKKRSLLIVRDIERQVSRYLGAVTLINIGLGALVALGLWLVGMPYPLLWGVVACLLNFVPFLGNVIGVATVTAVALVTFDTPGQALLPPLVYFLINSVEGQVVTPLLVGRTLEINTAATFLTVVFWVWLWGLPGALLAVPMLVVLKVIADNVDGLHGLGRFLSAD